MKKITNKRVMVTGSCGTVGSELIKQLLSNELYSPKEVIGIDNNESELFFQDLEYATDSRASFFIVDICDKGSLSVKMRNIDIVIHAAALKHVILGEKSPEQVLKTNVLGVQNVISAATANNVEILIFTSSDKAVNPTNVMGASKLMGERLLTAANTNMHGEGPIFASTRFGNVLGSNGSVLPIFKKQIENKQPLTLTDKRMSRFVMSVEQSVELILDSLELVQGGEIFVTKMPVIKIDDLASAMIKMIGNQNIKDVDQIIEIGSKPGEKLFEELMSSEEVRRTIELDRYFVILPSFQNVENYKYDSIVNKKIDNPYISSIENELSVDEIINFLELHKLLKSQ